MSEYGCPLGCDNAPRAIYRCDCLSSNPDKLPPLGLTESAEDRLLEIHADLLHFADELRAGQARISAALEVIAMAQVVILLALAALFFGMRGGP